MCENEYWKRFRYFSIDIEEPIFLTTYIALSLLFLMPCLTVYNI